MMVFLWEVVCAVDFGLRGAVLNWFVELAGCLCDGG